jgi:hypothetical protein
MFPRSDKLGTRHITDCWAVWSSTSGTTSITVSLTDSAGASDVTNMDLFFSE